MGYSPPPHSDMANGNQAHASGLVSGVAIWSKIGFVVDFRNLLFGCDFDLLFSKDYTLMKIFNYEGHFTAKCDT
jgi:hypothetical protein